MSTCMNEAVSGTHSPLPAQSHKAFSPDLMSSISWGPLSLGAPPAWAVEAADPALQSASFGTSPV